MPLTQINTQIGDIHPEADIIAIALLTEHAQQQVRRLQSSLSASLGKAAWMMPVTSLHITLCEIVQPKPYKQDKAQLLANLGHYQIILRDILARTPVNVRFDSIEASEHAIIICGHDDGSFAYIRDRLVKELPLPSETKAPPDIIHSSIARYTEAVDLDGVKAVTASKRLAFTESINEFQLLNATSPHLLKYTVAERFTLMN